MLSLRLGQLAITAGCTTAEIKKFMREGVLPAPNLKGTKLESFDQRHLNRLELILVCREVDLSFPQIRALMSTGDDALLSDAAEVDLARRIQTKIERLENLRRWLRTKANSRQSGS